MVVIYARLYPTPGLICQDVDVKHCFFPCFALVISSLQSAKQDADTDIWWSMLYKRENELECAFFLSSNGHQRILDIQRYVICMYRWTDELMTFHLVSFVSPTEFSERIKLIQQISHCIYLYYPRGLAAVM